jgi:hypothetical protein
MGEFQVTMPDGSQYTATADTPEEAHQAVSDHIRTEASKKDFEDAPLVKKARMTIGDPINQIVHGMTAGLFDKGFDYLTGKNSAAETQAGADRMGPVATGAARVGGAMMLPSMGPRAVATVGGGPLVRGLIGTGVAGAEGGAYGGINAATSGQDVPTGILGGTVGGAAGQGIAQTVGNLVNKGAKWLRGINDAAPVRNITSTKNMTSVTPTDLVDVAAAKAASVGRQSGSEAGQAAAQSNFEKLLTGPQKNVFTKSQRNAIEDVAYPDTGTKAAESVGNFLNNKLFAGGILAGGHSGTSAALAGTMLGSGKALELDSAKATQEAVDRLRALMYGKVPFKGPLSADKMRTIGQGLGYGGREGIEDYINN